MENNFVKALLLDVGGVLMTNGWDHSLRAKVAEHFNIELDEMNARHGLVFDTFETGKISFDEYLTMVIFFEKRPYSLQDVKTFVFESVRPFQDTIDYIKAIKAEHNLKIGVVSNEGRELAVDRIRRFELTSFVDFFVVSSFVHYRKPDNDIYHLAIDIVQVPPSQIVYIDDRKLLIETAKRLGVQGIWHESLETTKANLENLLHVKTMA